DPVARGKHALCRRVHVVRKVVAGVKIDERRVVRFEIGCGDGAHHRGDSRVDRGPRGSGGERERNERNGGKNAGNVHESIFTPCSVSTFWPAATGRSTPAGPMIWSA